MMNRTWKSVCSVLLAVALLLPMVPAVRAEEIVSGEAVKVTGDVITPSDLTLTPREGTVYWRKSNAGEITVTATVEPAGYSGPIEWKLTSSAIEPPLKFKANGSSETFSGNVSGGAATVTLQAMEPSVAGNNVRLEAKVGSLSKFVDITVKPDTINTSNILFENEAISIQVDNKAQVKLKPEPAYPSAVGAPSVTYKSSKPTVAEVDEYGWVTGKSAGRAEITASIDGEPLRSSSKVVVTVTDPSTSLTGNATLGTNFSMQGIYDSLNTKFSSTYGEQPKKVYFYNLNKINGTLTDKGGSAVASSDLNKSNEYTFSQLHDMYLVPSSRGEFKCTIKVTNNDGTKVVDGEVVITISLPDHTVRIPIEGSANYSFARVSADSSGRTGVQLFKEALGTFGSVKFNAVSTASSNTGTLYTSNPPSINNRVSDETVVSASSIDELYFTPSRAGTYSITFTAYSAYNETSGDAAGTALCTGTLILSVDGNSLDLSFTLNNVAPYTFSTSTNANVDSLYFQLVNTINGAVGTSWGGIKFDGAASAPSTGTLHQNSSIDRAISSSDYISKTYISQLYYVPARAGTYEIAYGVYSNESNDKAIATGILTIKTSTIPNGASDITYTTSVKGSVTLRESDFINFFQEVHGSKYELSYVVFNEYEGDGTFYHGTSSFLPYNSADFYTGAYSGDVPANARYLDRLSFTAPSEAGYTAVLFTCYGGTTTSSASTVTTGKLCIYYTAENVPAVSYNAFNAASVSLDEASFVTAYNTAMKTSISKPVFTIQLLNTPSKGTLYHYYSDSSRRPLASNTIANYTFTINDTSGNSVDELTYIPGRNTSGIDEISYLATSSKGAVLYVGTIEFKLSSDLTLNVTNDGSNFQLSDFYNANDSDPVLYVTFPQPSAGKVYVYADGRYIAAPTGTRFYTASSLNGQYPLTSAFYAPKANETGTVSIKCTSHRKSGVTVENTIILNVLSKSSSATFGDVTGVTGWAANSIDFASKMGLVNGTQLNPPRFSPSDTMRRSDFVLMLYRLAGSPAVSGSAPYTDVAPGKYYYDSAVWASRNNIMRNVTVGSLYNPEGALTRQDFAQILFNYTAAMGESTSNNGSISSYIDASSVSSNTVEGVTWAVAKGYITSAVVGQLYIEPTRSATRAEISTLLHRYLTY